MLNPQREKFESVSHLVKLVDPPPVLRRGQLQIVFVEGRSDEQFDWMVIEDDDGKPGRYHRSFKALIGADALSSRFVELPMKGTGLFILGCKSCEGVKKLHKNRFAATHWGASICGPLIVTRARMCGHNRSLFDYESICPDEFNKLLGLIADHVELLKQPRMSISKPVCKEVVKGPVRVWHALSASKEFWLELVEERARRGTSLGATVWCAKCHSFYRRLRPCPGCHVAAYCSRACREGDSEHKVVCQDLKENAIRSGY